MCDVLIVDDDQDAAEAFQDMLHEQRYDVVVAGSAEAALREMARAIPRAVLVDFHLPRVNGVELLRRLRAIPALKDVPAALVTGDYLIDDETVLAVHDLGATVVFKPLWGEDLRRLVTTLQTAAAARPNI